MASLHFKKIIQDFCSYFGITLNNLSFSFDNRIPVAQIKEKNEVVLGLRNIVSLASKPDTPENDANQDQWVEYILTSIHNLDVSFALQVLKELNDYMIDKVYFVGNQLGPIDILMYFFLYNFVSDLTFQEKEKYLHTSRWFNNVQQNKNARLGRSIIPFSRSCLYT